MLQLVAILVIINNFIYKNICFYCAPSKMIGNVNYFSVNIKWLIVIKYSIMPQEIFQKLNKKAMYFIHEIFSKLRNIFSIHGSERQKSEFMSSWRLAFIFRAISSDFCISNQMFNILFRPSQGTDVAYSQLLK